MQPTEQIAPERMLRLTQDLVAINSVNPSLVASGAGEGEVARYVAEFFRRAGLETTVEEVLPGRPNVIARLRASKTGHRLPGPRLLIVGHMDTVGVEGMVEAFARRFEDGRIYGRGAMDIKGGVAAMLAAGEVLARRGLDAGECIFAAVVDEEYASAGTEHLVKHVAADWAIVLEPTDLKVGVAHKGFTWAEITTHGRAAHGSRPEEGEDAIRMMGYVLSELDQLEIRLRRTAAHPLLGQASLHASLIEGGQELSSYPESCRLQLERRTLPGEGAEAAARELEEVMAAARRARAGFRGEARVVFSRDAYEIPENAEIVRAVSQAAKAVTGKGELAGMSFWTDTPILARAGIAGVVFGPGGRGMHAAEESVPLAEVVACAQVLVLTAVELGLAKK